MVLQQEWFTFFAVLSTFSQHLAYSKKVLSLVPVHVTCHLSLAAVNM